MTDEKYLKIPEFAEAKRISPSTVYRLVREGRIPALRVGGQWRILPDADERMLGAQAA